MADECHKQSSSGDVVRSVAGVGLAFAGIIGLAGYVLALVEVQDVQFNVVTHKTVKIALPLYVPALVFAGVVPLAVVAFAVWAAWHRGGFFPRLANAGRLLAPLCLTLPVGVYLFMPSATVPFGLSFVLILGGGWAAWRVAAAWRPLREPGGMKLIAPLALGVVLAVVVMLHTLLQINFFEHFMLGHADFGHFTEELKNCLAGRGLRSDSFGNVRLGWHFVPLLYVLVPGYAVWPSPVYLMVCSALFVHLPALPAYFLGRRLAGSATAGLVAALAWLLLPSTSRLVYSSTYGFQWIYFAMPLIGVLLAAEICRRRKLAGAMVVPLLLCKETVSALTLGYGTYLALFTRRRIWGLVVIAGSVVYLVLCLKVFIPHFAASGQYERFDLFGELGDNALELLASPFVQPGLFFERLFRRQAWYFLLMLLVPMGLLPLLRWRLSVVALPTLAMVLLLKNPEWLSIKFWHQATVLPVLFFAALAVLKDAGSPAAAHRRRGALAALLTCAALGHYFFAFSPLSKPYEAYAQAAALHRPDPRLAAVRELRAEIPKEASVLATERLAAHFTDYRKVYTGKRIRPADFVVIDRADRWDTSGLARKAPEFAADPDYSFCGEYGSIVVFRKQTDKNADSELKEGP